MAISAAGHDRRSEENGSHRGATAIPLPLFPVPCSPLANERLDFRRLALVVVAGVGVVTVNAVLAEPAPLPDEVVHRALKSRDPRLKLLEIPCAPFCHPLPLSRGRLPGSNMER